MLSWLFPRCPVDPSEQAWIERRFGWLVRQFGADQLHRCEVVQPTDEFFPEPYDAQFDDAVRLFGQTARRLGIAEDSLGLEVLPDHEIPDAAGHYDSTDRMIRLAESQLLDPELLVATLAHELSHELLLGGGKQTGDEHDLEWTTDLTTVLFGYGIFTANATIQEESGSVGNWSFWSMQRQGYLPSRMIGYALALFAWLRGEHRPAWRRHLRVDALVAFNQGLNYLRRKRDCPIDRENPAAEFRPSTSELVFALTSGTAAARIHAAWAVGDHDNISDNASEAMVANLRHRSRQVRAAMATAIGRLPTCPPGALEELAHALGDPAEAVRRAAASALGELQPSDDHVVSALAAALADQDKGVVVSAAGALAGYGSQAAGHEKPFLKAIHQALIDCDYGRSDTLLLAFDQVAEDAGQSLNLYFTEVDPELRRMAIDALYALTSGESPEENDDQASETPAARNQT